jgi:hypothetical protein
MHARKNKIFRVGNRKYHTNELYPCLQMCCMSLITMCTRAHATGIQWMSKIFRVIGETDGAGINTRYRIMEECRSAKIGLGVPPLRELHKMSTAICQGVGIEPHLVVTTFKWSSAQANCWYRLTYIEGHCRY